MVCQCIICSVPARKVCQIFLDFNAEDPVGFVQKPENQGDDTASRPHVENPLGWLGPGSMGEDDRIDGEPVAIGRLSNRKGAVEKGVLGN